MELLLGFILLIFLCDHSSIVNIGVNSIDTRCSWTSWSQSVSCQWIHSSCIPSYSRNCSCNGKLSQGHLCGNPNFYIEHKPYVNIFHKPFRQCYRDDCPKYQNWCKWKSWTKWKTYENSTCYRKRIRRCCQTGPIIGYTFSASKNKGCFISNSNRSEQQSQTEYKEMNCTGFLYKWKSIIIYVSIALGSVLAVAAICLSTNSCGQSKNNKNNKLKSNSIELGDGNMSDNDELSSFSDEEEEGLPNFNNINNLNKSIIPTAPGPVRNDEPSAPPGNSHIPITPPPYSEIMGCPANNSGAQPPIFTTGDNRDETKQISKDTISHTSSEFISATTPADALNIPPPNYTMTTRNSHLFRRT